MASFGVRNYFKRVSLQKQFQTYQNVAFIDTHFCHR